MGEPLAPNVAKIYEEDLRRRNNPGKYFLNCQHAGVLWIKGKDSKL